MDQDIDEKNEFYAFDIELSPAKDGLKRAKRYAILIASFGFAWFWLLESNRQDFWQQVSFLGRSCSYNGDPRQLFLANLAAMASVAIGVVLSIATYFFFAEWFMPVAGAVGCVFVFAYPAWAYLNFRWMVSRISWGDETLAYEMSMTAYCSRYLGGLALTILSAGLYWPFWRNQVFAMRYGYLSTETLAIRYTGDARDLWEDYVTAVPMIIGSGGLYGFWFFAKIQRYRCANLWVGHQEIGRARGYYRYKGERALMECLASTTSTILTAGLALPWVRSLLELWHWRSFNFVGKLYLNRSGNN